MENKTRTTSFVQSFLDCPKNTGSVLRLNFVRDVVIESESSVDDLVYEVGIPRSGKTVGVVGRTVSSASARQGSAVEFLVRSGRDPGCDRCVVNPNIVLRVCGTGRDRMVQAWSSSPRTMDEYVQRMSEQPDFEAIGSSGSVCGDLVITVRSNFVCTRRVSRAMPIIGDKKKRDKRSFESMGAGAMSLAFSRDTDVIDDVRVRSDGTLVAVGIRYHTDSSPRREAVVAETYSPDCPQRTFVLDGRSREARCSSISPSGRVIFVAYDGETTTVRRFSGENYEAIPVDSVVRTSLERTQMRLVALSDSAFFFHLPKERKICVFPALSVIDDAEWSELRDNILFVGTAEGNITAVDIETGSIVGKGSIPDAFRLGRNPLRKFPISRNKGGLISDRIGNITTIFY